MTRIVVDTGVVRASLSRRRRSRGRPVDRGQRSPHRRAAADRRLDLRRRTRRGRGWAVVARHVELSVGEPTHDAERVIVLCVSNATAVFWKPQVALFVNEATLLPVLMPLAPAESLADRFPEHIEAVLNAPGTDPRFVAAEIAATTDAQWAKTANRSVVGMMNEFSLLAEVDRAHERSEDLVSMSVRPAGTPCSPLYKRHSFPDRELAALVTSHLPG